MNQQNKATRPSLAGMLLTILVLLLLTACTTNISGTGGTGTTTGTGGTGSTSGNTPTGSVSEPQWGVQQKTSGCRAQSGLQDKACTPGALFASATKAQICTSGYAGSVRNVPQSEKNQVYAEYGIATHTAGEYEVDHLVSLQLGGSNDIANLWPEAANPTPGFHQKDAVENYLHDQICKGFISVKEAQIEIATNWLAVYQRMPTKSGGVNATPNA